MTEIPEKRSGTRKVVVAAVAVIVILELGALLYFDTALFGTQAPNIPFTFTSQTLRTTTTSTTSTKTGPPPDTVDIESATMFNDTLSLQVKNVGSTWTSTIGITGICTPGLGRCYSYPTLSGKASTQIFVLGPSQEFLDNMSNVCVVPLGGCLHYKPVVNGTYYYAVTVGFADGKSKTFPVTVMDNNTYPFTASVEGLGEDLYVSPVNGSGVLNVTIDVNSSLNAGNFTEALYASVDKSAFADRLLYNETGCGGALPQDCSNGVIFGITNFTSEQTGIGTPVYQPPFLLVVRDLTVKHEDLYFTIWVETVVGGYTTTTTTKSTTT